MSRKFLYLECLSGISGDMTVAALLDLGADKNVLLNGLDSLKLTGYSVKIEQVMKNGIDACDFDVALSNEATQEPVHRHLNDIFEIINHSQITADAKKLACRIFMIVAKAEAKAHGISMDEVHFHEVGAVDSIIDIVSASILIDNLGIADSFISELYEGTGQVKCQHGILSVPVPAVTNIVQTEGLHLKITQNQGEMVTPTGAAIAAAFRTMDALPSNSTILKTGYGAGEKDFQQPNVLKACIMETDN